MKKTLLTLALVLALAGYANASWMFAITTVQGGQPNVDFQATPIHGYVLAGQVGQYGAYIFSGTNAQLLALNALPNVVGLVAVTKSGDVVWAELDNVINPTVRTRLNTWLTNNGYQTIPSTWTNKQVVVAVFKRLRSSWDWNQDWVKDE